MSNTVATYNVVGMSCQHCVDSITAEVGKLPGVEQVEVDLGAGAVTVRSAAPLTDEQIRDAVDEAGFDLAAERPEES